MRLPNPGNLLCHHVHTSPCRVPRDVYLRGEASIRRHIYVHKTPDGMIAGVACRTGWKFIWHDLANSYWPYSSKTAMAAYVL